MPRARSILCPVDFSEESRQALRWSSTIAQCRGGELTVLSVVDPLLARTAGIRLGVDLLRQEAEPALREFVEATLPEPVRQAATIRMEVTIGDVSETVLRTARSRNVGLIVMGTHGLGGFRKLLLGSTTEKVLGRTEWPVLAVPAGAVSAPMAERPGMQVRKVMVATDFRESAVAAMRWAGELAADLGVPLVLAHVVEPVAMPPWWEALRAETESDRLSSAERMLARLSASLPGTNTDPVVSFGRPADTIASLAVEHGAGLVVMGLANPKDPERRTPGSIAYRVLRMAHVAVVVVPARRRKLRPTGQPPALVAGAEESPRRQR